MPEMRSSIAAGVPGSLAGEAVAAGRAPVDVLVVDDNPAKLLAVETALAPLGENVVTARSGREALKHLLSRDFATVVLDVSMPDLDGFETARMIRSRHRSATTPIIFVSAVNMDEADADRAYSLGAVDYIFAPISPEVLRAKVSVFVELHRKSEEARSQAEQLRERTKQLEQSQRELRLSERMASIGTLCAGLGHDMGNLLLPISIWIDGLKADDVHADAAQGLENLRSCVQYLRRLANGLRLVSLDPSQELGPARLRLAQWLDEAEPVLRNALPRGVAFTHSFEEGLPSVEIAAHRLAQAMFNLVQNAGEALREQSGGVVKLWARAEPPAGVRVGVSDNGPGMSAEVLKQCMDPFFTTKTRGLSTGLGLSLVHGVAQSAGSRLDVVSEPGKGTTFSFVVPASGLQERSSGAVAVVTVSDPRRRAVASALAEAAGCEVVERLAEPVSSPAVWVTDTVEGLEDAARAFTGGRAVRAVFVIAEEAPACPGVRSAPLTGPNSLSTQLQGFLRSAVSNGRRRVGGGGRSVPARQVGAAPGGG